jgi:cold shock CspA family protein
VVERKGFGFILPDGKDVADVMLHCSQLNGSSSSSRDDLHVGMRVRYQPETDAHTGKKRAWCVTVLQVPDSVKSDNVSRRADREARASKAKSRAHESLDDEYLIGKIEERLSKESGFDDANDETFGESRGWSFEEAVAANARLAAGARLAAAKADWEYSGPPADISVDSSDSTADGTPTGRSGGQSRSNSPDPCLVQAEEFLQGGWLPGYMLEGLQLQ